MPKAPNLLKAFEKGELLHFSLGNGEFKEVPSGRAWLILGGQIRFTTLTICQIYTFKNSVDPLGYNRVENFYTIAHISSATVSGVYPLFGTISNSSGFLIVLEAGDVIAVAMDGDAQFTVLEWTP